MVPYVGILRMLEHLGMRVIRADGNKDAVRATRALLRGSRAVRARKVAICGLRRRSRAYLLPRLTGARICIFIYSVNRARRKFACEHMIAEERRRERERDIMTGLVHVRVVYVREFDAMYGSYVM